jgi:Bacteriocin (Lactococcin_972)
MYPVRLRSPGTRAAKVVAVASMATMMFAGGGGVSAAQAAPGIGGAVPAGGVALSDCESAGDGTWCHGWTLDGLTSKYCYSNYKHNSNYHSSTASIGDAVDTRYAQAGYWSNAAATAGAAWTCYTYYNASP